MGICWTWQSTCTHLNSSVNIFFDRILRGVMMPYTNFLMCNWRVKFKKFMIKHNKYDFFLILNDLSVCKLSYTWRKLVWLTAKRHFLNLLKFFYKPPLKNNYETLKIAYKNGALSWNWFIDESTSLELLSMLRASLFKWGLSILKDILK